MRIASCRMCGSKENTRFLDLGFTPPADDFIPAERLDQPETHYPLKVVRCDVCMQVQLDYVVDKEILYQNDYPYESSTTIAGRTHFDGLAAQAVEEFNFPPDSLAVDIGSNVGVLLAGFQRRNMRVLGIEPASNIAALAEENGIPTVNKFFEPRTVAEVVRDHGKAIVITATNVFAHIDNLHETIAGVKSLLDPDGVFVIEAPYFVHLINNLEFDTIYHEHLSYISITPLVPFFAGHGLEIFNVHQVDIHGGSIRIMVGFKGRHAIRPDVPNLLDFEADHQIFSDESLNNFARRVANLRTDLVQLLASLKQTGHRIAGVSAPAKGMTLLNYCKIGTETLEFLTEKSILKIGKYAPGSHIPILPDSSLVTENIDYALLLAWNFKDEIMANLSDFREAGGKFIIPVPTPTIIDNREYQYKV